MVGDVVRNELVWDGGEGGSAGGGVGVIEEREKSKSPYLDLVSDAL